jgi:hypothetical protein
VSDVYDSAAVRHYQDASFLRDESSYDNAGHLVGFAAECATKHALRNLRNSQSAVYGHFPELAASARQQFQTRAQYQALVRIFDANFMKNWDVNRRYKATGTTTQAEVNQWFECAKKILAASGVRVRL